MVDDLAKEVTHRTGRKKELKSAYESNEAIPALVDRDPDIDRLQQ